MLRKILLITFLFSLGLSLKAQVNPYPLVSIDSLQFVKASKLDSNNTSPDYISPFSKNPTYKDTIQVEGIVTFDPKTYGLSTTKSRYGAFLQTKDTASPWGAIHVLLNKDIYPSDSVGGLDLIVDFFTNFKKGTKVKCTGVISEFQGSTQMNLLKVKSEITDLNVVSIKPRTLNVSDFELNVGGIQTYQPKTGEKWEGAYVEFKNVTVVDRAANGASRWNFALQDDKGNKIKFYDVSGYYRNDDFDRDPATPVAFAPPANGTLLSYVRGTIVELVSGGVTEYRICPLLPTDIGPTTFLPPVITNRRHLPVIATSTDTVRLSARITDDSTVVNATLYYAIGATNNTFIAAPMTALANNIWEAKVAPQANGTVVKYWFRAWDNGGHNSVDTVANALAYMVVDGGIKTIAQLQYSPFSSGNSIWTNDTLTGIQVGGLVTSSLYDMEQSSTYFFGSLQSGTAPNSGIFFQAQANDSVATWKRGDSIVITSCIVRENFNVTTLDRIGYYSGTKNYNIVSRNNNLPVPLTTLPIDSVIGKIYNYTEPYEGMLVRFNDVYVVNKNPDAPSNNGEWSVYKDTSTTNGLRFDDASKDIGSTYNLDSLTLKTLKYNYMQGVLYFSFSNWKPEPRDRADINGKDYIAPVITLNGKDTVTVNTGSTYTDAGAVAYDNNDGNITSKIVVTNPVNTSIPATYTILYNVKDNAGNAATEVKRIVIVKNGAGVNNATMGQSLTLYPNPAGNTVFIAYTASVASKGNLSITDLSGKTLYSLAFDQVAGSNTIEVPVSRLNHGIYIIKVETEEGVRSSRFVK